MTGKVSCCTSLTGLLNLSFTGDLVLLLLDFDASLDFDRGLKSTAT